MATAEPAYFEKLVTQDAAGATTAASIPYIVRGVADEDTAVATARAAAPATYGDLVFDTATLAETLNDTTYKVEVNYKSREKKEQEEPEPTYAFDTGGGSVHLTQSLATRNKYPADAPDYAGAIGYDGESVNGCDVTRPVYSFSETHYFKPTVVTESFRNNLARKTGMYNNDAFRGFEDGEVLFMGASGRRTGDDPDDLWEITYNFSVQRNQTNLDIGGITVATKRGWDYLWVRYEDQISSDSKSVLKMPVAVYIEKVYYGTDFTSLGIGN